MFGSSPHTRGTLDADIGRASVGRFIPACAGNASRALTRRGPTSVHPRMRGERTRWWSNIATRGGLSPHTRGTLERHRRLLGLWRFIPAYARHTSEHDQKHSCRTVHPRMREERLVNSCRISSQRGSSPHMRGTHLVRMTQADHVRFIPAYAGNARAACSVSRRCSVHPRMRGERVIVPVGDPIARGSSPHARGTPSSAGPRRLCSRFIPACAGNATAAPYSSRRGSVHPRMRGERLRGQAVDPPPDGSSPHARGTPTSSNLVQHYSRFIPACAGNAASTASGAGFCSVHPRMRGERLARPGGIDMQGGSSPHARGTRQLGAPR